MSPVVALVMLSLPANEVLAPFRAKELTRRPVPGSPLVEVLALSGRAGRWLELAGRLVPPTPEGAAELTPPTSQADAERLVTSFEAGKMISRGRAAKVVRELPPAATGPLVVERFVARARADGGAELVHLVLRFGKPGARREETVLLRVGGTAADDAPATAAPQPSAALAQFWADLAD